MNIAKVPIDAIFEAAEFPDLIAEYARESAVAGLPSPEVKMETYRLYELTGALHSFWAMRKGEMIGFITVLAPPSLHFTVPIAVTESFFVTADQRKTGAGLKLLAMAEGQARVVGAPGLMICAPFHSRLCKILPRRGYRQTNAVFFKGFASVH